MRSSSSEIQTYLSKPESIEIDAYTARGIIGFLACILPFAVWGLILLSKYKISDSISCVSCIFNSMPNSISWSYYTIAHDIYVGALCVLGAFLMAYKGHQPNLPPNEIHLFWKIIGEIAGIFGKQKDKVSQSGRRNEEDIIGWIGGIAACIAAVLPTSYDPTNGTKDIITIIHFLGGFTLFSITVYFCLVAFSRKAYQKIRAKIDVKQATTRLICYWVCGVGIIVIMACLFFNLIPIKNPIFIAETIALELFGFAWLVASFVPKEKLPKHSTS